MRKLLTALLIALLATPALAPAVWAATIIYPHQARAYVGRAVTVRGNVDGIHQGRKIVYVDLDGRGRHAGLVVAVYPGAVDVFDDAATLPGKMIEVSGRIQIVNGQPQITVDNTRQLYVKE